MFGLSDIYNRKNKYLCSLHRNSSLPFLREREREAVSVMLIAICSFVPLHEFNFFNSTLIGIYYVA